MMKSQRNWTHVEYTKFLPDCLERLKLRELEKVPFELGCKQEGWA
jgi:hypothetical protein